MLGNNTHVLPLLLLPLPHARSLLCLYGIQLLKHTDVKKLASELDMLMPQSGGHWQHGYEYPCTSCTKRRQPRHLNRERWTWGPMWWLGLKRGHFVAAFVHGCGSSVDAHFWLTLNVAHRYHQKSRGLGPCKLSGVHPHHMIHGGGGLVGWVGEWVGGTCWLGGTSRVKVQFLVHANLLVPHLSPSKYTSQKRQTSKVTPTVQGFDTLPALYLDGCRPGLPKALPYIGHFSSPEEQ